MLPQEELQVGADCKDDVIDTSQDDEEDMHVDDVIDMNSLTSGLVTSERPDDISSSRVKRSLLQQIESMEHIMRQQSQLNYRHLSPSHVYHSLRGKLGQHRLSVQPPQQPSYDVPRPTVLPFKSAARDGWVWSCHDRSPEVVVCDEGRRVLFHPNWSNGTAAVRSSRPLLSAFHYWEVHISQRVFGTAMMVGIATRQARLHVPEFVHLMGEDEHSWSLSHKGMLWHGGQSRPFTKPFRENESTTIGVLLDRALGHLSFFKDGVPLGVAFTGLDKVTDELYPMVSSTAAKTEMKVGVSVRSFGNLVDRCLSAVASQLSHAQDVGKLPLPGTLKSHITEHYALGGNNVLQ